MKCSPGADVPTAVVAVTVTVPAVCAGEVTLIWLVLTKVTVPAPIVVPPNVTEVAPEMKPLPVRVTVVPPAVGPAGGETLVMVGAETYVKCSPDPEVPPVVVALTVTVAAPWDGEVTLIFVALTKVTEPAGMTVPPNVTVVAPETKLLPVSVTVVPPVAGPFVGVTLVMVGTGRPASAVVESNGPWVVDPVVWNVVNVVVTV